MFDILARTEEVESFADAGEMDQRFNSACGIFSEIILGCITHNVTGVLHDVVNYVGLRHVACIRFETNRSDDISLLSALVTYSKEWQLRYFTRRYQEVDPAFLIGLKAPAPFDWAPFRTLTPQSAAFFADAVVHGVGANGLTVPIRGRQGGFSLVSFSSDLPEIDWEVYKLTYMKKLKVLACLIDTAASINVKLASKIVDLSRREREALIWAARGKCNAETALLMGVSYATVRTYIETAKRKLRCENVTHAVAVAMAIGLVPALALKGSDPRGYSGKDEAEEEAA